MPTTTETEEPEVKKKRSKLSASEKEKKAVQLAEQRFRRAESAIAEKQQLWAMLDMFDRGDQWKNQSLPPWIPKPVTNYIRFVRTLKRANMASAIPMAHFSALMQDNAETIGRLSKAYKHVWEWENVHRTVRRCIDRAFLQGTAVAYVYSDDSYVGGIYYDNEKKSKNALFQGKICVKRFPITNFFPDPDVYRVEDCKYIDITELLPLSHIKDNEAFKKYAGADRIKSLKVSQPDTEATASGTIFTRDADPTQAQDVPTGDELVTLHAQWSRKLVNGRYEYELMYWIKEADFPLLVVEDVEPRDYPFAVLYDEEEEQDFHGTSVCMDILENQKIINKTQQNASIIGVLHQNPQKVVSRESGVNAQEMARTSTLPGKVWTANGDATKAVHVIQPSDIPKGLFEIDDRVTAKIKDTAGINEAYTGQSVGSLTTSTGVNSLIERATIRDKDKMVQIDEFVERISHLIMLHIINKWKDKRQIPTKNPDGTMSYDTFEPIEKDVAENLEWYVKCDTYAVSPTTVASRKQQADNLLQQQGQFKFNPPVITPEEWILMQDFEQKEDILKRMQKDRQALNRTQAQDLTAVIMQVADQVQQAKSAGLSPQEVQQMTQEFAQKLMEQRQQAGQANAPAQPNAPQGTTGALAMSAMARGN